MTDQQQPELAQRIRRQVQEQWHGDSDVVDELIAERRAEAEHEAAES